MRALVRFHWLLPAIAVPLSIGLAGVGLQAAAFGRPARETLVAADAVRELLQYRVMRGTEVIDGRRLTTTCVQGWYRARRHEHLAPGAIVLFSNGERLYDFGNGVHRVGLRGRVGIVDRARFLLAGCPRFIGGRISKRLLGGPGVDTDQSQADGMATLRIAFGTRRKPIELYVQPRTLRPVELTLASAHISGSSDLVPGGGRAAVVRVRRAFHLPTHRRMQHA